MGGTFSRIGEFVVRLMQGGTFEIILLIVLVIVTLVLFLVALWIFIKLLILLGKGLLWLLKTGSEKAKERAAVRRETKLAAMPAVATNWEATRNIGLGRALARARRLAGRDAMTIVVISGEGFTDLCRGLSLTPPGPGVIGVGADDGIILVDATQADRAGLRRLSRALPWRRPADALAALVSAEGIEPETLARAAGFARATGMVTALHLVLPSQGVVAARCIIDQQNRDGTGLTSRVAGDAVRVWLEGGSRSGLKNLALAQSYGLSSSIDRALAAAPSALDITSLCFGGIGLRYSVAQTLERTRPSAAPGILTWIAIGILSMGVGLTLLAGVVAYQRTLDLRGTLDMAVREASASWRAEGIEVIPSPTRVWRFSGLSSRLADFSSFSWVMPLAVLVPNFEAPRRLGGEFLITYVLRPLARALERQSTARLAPTDTPELWLSDARLVDEWLAAWVGLSDNPREVDIQRLFVDAFGGDRTTWAEGTDEALIVTGVKPPVAGDGGLDVDRITDIARQNFILTMQNWADKVYTNGPVAHAARAAIDRSSNWRSQYRALLDLRRALQDPAQKWLTAAKDRPDFVYEVQILGRALALSILGETNALEAKASVAAIRIAAREAPEYFIRPEIGPLLTRSGGGSGPSLVMSRPAEAWLAFLERIATAGFADLPLVAPLYLAGPVEVDVGSVAEVRRKLRIFERFATSVPPDLPPGIGQNLIREVASELVVGVANAVEFSLRPRSRVGTASEQASRLAQGANALVDLTEIEGWLREREARDEADRVLAVRGRIAENVLAVSALVLIEEDPLGVFPDSSADQAALTRRFARGIDRTQRIYEQFAESFIEAGVAAGGRAAAQWLAIKTDIDGFKRGDANSALTALEGMVQAYSDDPATACASRLSPAAGTRDDYIARALLRFRRAVVRACDNRTIGAARKVVGQLVSYYESNLAWLWPFSGDPTATETAPPKMSDFVKQVVAAKGDLALVDSTLAERLGAFARLWTYDKQQGAGVSFRIAWRTRPNEENLAENIIAFEVEGPAVDENGTYTWRYGSPMTVNIRLAKNSRYRFTSPTAKEGLVFPVTAPGNGAFLRIFNGLAEGSVLWQLSMVDADGVPAMLRISARVTDADGGLLTIPNLAGTL